MSKTYRQLRSKFDDERKQGRGGKHHTHANNRKTHGMKVVNDITNIDDEIYEEDEVFVINKVVRNSTQ